MLTLILLILTSTSCSLLSSACHPQYSSLSTCLNLHFPWSFLTSKTFSDTCSLQNRICIGKNYGTSKWPHGFLATLAPAILLQPHWPLLFLLTCQAHLSFRAVPSAWTALLQGFYMAHFLATSRSWTKYHPLSEDFFDSSIYHWKMLGGTFENGSQWSSSAGTQVLI